RPPPSPAVPAAATDWWSSARRSHSGRAARAIDSLVPAAETHADPRRKRMRVPRSAPLMGVAGMAALTVIGLVPLQPARGADGSPTPNAVLATFNAHGSYTWKVPAGVKKVIIDVYGASGGNFVNGSVLIRLGGVGGEARGQFA